jgi:hypothetical protein
MSIVINNTDIIYTLNHLYWSQNLKCDSHFRCPCATSSLYGHAMEPQDRRLALCGCTWCSTSCAKNPSPAHKRTQRFHELLRNTFHARVPILHRRSVALLQSNRVNLQQQNTIINTCTCSSILYAIYIPTRTFNFSNLVIGIFRFTRSHRRHRQLRLCVDLCVDTDLLRGTGTPQQISI